MIDKPIVLSFLSVFWFVFCLLFVVLWIGGSADHAPLIALMALDLSICYAFLWARSVKS